MGPLSPLFTNGDTNRCSIQSYSYYITPDYNVTSSGDINVNTLITGSYSLYVEVTTIFKSAVNNIPVEVVCGGTEKPILSTATAFPNIFNYEIDLSDARPYYLFTEYTDSMGCGVTYTVSTSNTMDITPSSAAVEENRFDMSSPPDVKYHLDDSYQDIEGFYPFFMKVSSADYFEYSGLLTLNVVCGPSSATISESSFDSTQTWEISSGHEYFELDVFTSNSAACSQFTYRVQVSASDTSLPAGLNDFQYKLNNPVHGVIEVWPVDITVAGTYTFYLYSEVNGGANLISGPHTLVIECGPGTIVTITEQPFTYAQSFEIDINATPYLAFPAYLNSAGCTNTYAVLNSANDPHPSFVNSPTFDTTTNLWNAYVEAGLEQVAQMRSFKIEVTAGGTTFLSPILSLDIFCGPNSATSIPSNPTSPQPGYITSGPEFFSMAEFGSTSTGCVDITYALHDVVVSDTSFSSLGLNSPVINSGNVEIHPTDTGKKATYTFYIQSAVSGGSIVTSGPYVLNMQCDSGSVVTITEQSFTYDQSFEIDITATPYLAFPEYLNTAGCTNTYTIVHPDDQLHVYLVNSPTFDASTDQWNVFVKAGYEQEVIKRFLKIQVTSGGTTITSPVLSLDIFCGYDSARIIPSSFVSPQIWEISSDDEFFRMPKFSSTSTGCADITYTLQNVIVSDTSFDSLTLNSPTINDDEIRVEIHPTDKVKKATYTFELYTEVSGGYNEVQGPYVLQIECGSSSMMDIDPQQTFDEHQIFEIQVDEIPFYKSTYYDNLAGCPNVKVLTLLNPQDPETGPETGGWPEIFEEPFVDQGTHDNFYLQEAYKYNKTTHGPFFVVVTSGAGMTVNGPLSLEVLCGPQSAILTPSEYESTQIFELGTESYNFTFKEYSSNSVCQPETCTITWISKNDEFYPSTFIQVLTVDENRYYNLPAPLNNSLYDFEFTITVEAEGGAQHVRQHCHLQLICSTVSKYMDAIELELESESSYNDEADVYDIGVEVQQQPQGNTIYYDSWYTFFDKKDMPSCPFSSCLLYRAGQCGQVPLQLSQLFIEENNPWRIFAKNNIPQGYEFEVCLRCINEFVNYDFDNWVIKQYGDPNVAYIEVNHYPEFLRDISDQVFEITPDLNQFEIAIPEIIANDISYVVILVKGFELFVEETTLVAYNVDETMLGTHKVEVSLIANGYYQTDYTFHIEVRLLQIVEFQEVEVIEFDSGLDELVEQEDLGNSENSTQTPIEITVGEFTNNGEMTLIFSEDIYDLSHQGQFNLTSINKDPSQILTLEYTCFLKTDDLIPMLQGYSFKEFTSKWAVLHLNFSNPLYVSIADIKDVITLEVSSPQIFKGKKNDNFLVANYTIKGIEVPTQLMEGEDFQSVFATGAGAQSAMLLTLAIPFCFMVFMSMSMNRVWALYNMIQLLVNLQKYEMIAIPGNLGLVLQVLYDMVNFSLLDQEPVQKFLKNHVFKRADALQKFLVGQGPFVTSLIFLSAAILIVNLGLRVKFLQKISLKIKNKLMFSSIFRSQIQTYFPTCILVFSQFKLGQDVLMSCFQLALLIGLPIFSWKFLKWNQYEYFHEGFQEQYGTLFQNLEPMTRSFYMHTSFFCLRRILVAFATVYFNMLVGQIYVNVFTSLFIIKFFVDEKPMEQRLQNKIEQINESFTMFSNYFMILFTDLIPNIEVRYQLGFKAIGVILVVVALNIVLVFYDLGSGVILQVRKARSKRAWDKYDQLEDKMVEYILHDIIKKSDPKLSAQEIEDKRRYLKYSQSFESKAAQIEELFNPKVETEPKVLNTIHDIQGKQMNDQLTPKYYSVFDKDLSRDEIKIQTPKFQAKVLAEYQKTSDILQPNLDKLHEAFPELRNKKQEVEESKQEEGDDFLQRLHDMEIDNVDPREFNSYEEFHDRIVEIEERFRRLRDPSYMSFRI